MLSEDPRMSCWYTLHGLLSFYEHSSFFNYRYLTELKWQTNKSKHFDLIGTAELCPRNVEVHEYCWMALFFLFTWIILDMLMFILLEAFNLDLWFHIRSQWCWNRVEQPSVPVYVFQSLLSAIKCWCSCVCSWCGWKIKWRRNEWLVGKGARLLK